MCSSDLQTFDDWVDGEDVALARRYDAIYQCLVGLTANPYYQANWTYIAPLLASALMHQVNQVQVSQAFHLSIKQETNHQFYFLQ